MTKILTGIVEEIGGLVQLNRKKDGKDIYKKVLTIKEADGQLSYIDVLNQRIKSVEDQNIEEGDIVEIEYSFKGSERDGKKFNNIFCNSITKI